METGFPFETATNKNLELFHVSTEHEKALAAAARHHELTLVTRNERDLSGLGAKILNPFGA
jgi:hypothetical protein